MSDQNNKIDRKYREGLSDFKYEVDIDDMWLDLEPRLEKVTKRQPVFFWLVLVGFCLLGSFFAFSHFITTNDTISAETRTEGATSFSKAEFEETTSSASKDFSTNQSKNKTPLNDKLILDKTLEKLVSTTIEKRPSLDKKVRLKHDNSSSINSTRRSIDADARIENLRKENNEFFVKDDLGLKNKALISHNNYVLSDSNDFNLGLEKEIILLDRKIVGIYNLNDGIKELTTKQIKIPLSINRNRQKDQVQKMTLALGSALYYSKSKSKSDNIDPLPSFDVNVTVTYSLSGLIKLKTGIEYLQINEKFDFERIIASTERIFAPDALYIKNDSEVNFLGDSVYIVNRILKKRKKLNTYKNWNIPIGLALTKSTDKFIYSLEASAIINLSSNFNGNILNEFGDDIISVDDDHDEFKSRIGIGFRIRPTLSYPLSSNLHLSLGLPFRISPYSDNYNNGYWKAVGLSAGLRCKF